MIPDITRCYLVLVTLIIHLSRHVTCDVICTNYTLPSRCTCSDGEGQPTKVTCVDAGLTSLPPVLPPAVDLVIENNTIDVIAHVSYGPTVRYLYLNRNKIQLIRNGAFRNLTNLETLSLASNELTSLRQETFFGLNILKTLILVGNPVYVLRVDTFDGNVLPRLENLDLDNCNLFEVEDGAVDGLPNLMFLTLSNNRLRRHPLLGCTRSSLTSLTTFDVSHNEISEIRRGSCRLPSLRNLNFSNNNIRALNASFFGTSTTSLGALYLRNNGLTFVDVDAFKGCRNLTVLDISHNRLTSLDNRTIQWGQIKSVIVGENPWHCDCGNMWLIEENAVKEYNADDAVRCSTPDIVQNLSVFSVYDSVFEQCVLSSETRVLPIVIGVACTIVAVCITCVVIYFAARKRRMRYPLVGMAAPRSGSSVYRRMSGGNEVVLDYTSTAVPSSGETANKPMWKEMSTYGPDNNPSTA